MCVYVGMPSRCGGTSTSLQSRRHLHVSILQVLAYDAPTQVRGLLRISLRLAASQRVSCQHDACVHERVYTSIERQTDIKETPETVSARCFPGRMCIQPDMRPARYLHPARYRCVAVYPAKSGGLYMCHHFRCVKGMHGVCSVCVRLKIGTRTGDNADRRVSLQACR